MISFGGRCEVQDILKYAWSLNNSGYYSGRIFNRLTFLHIEVLIRKEGPRPFGKVADHINRIRTDNRRENLRWVYRSTNQLHSISRKTVKNKKMYSLYFIKQCKRWAVGKTTGFNKTCLESFMKKEDAEIYLNNILKEYTDGTK